MTRKYLAALLALLAAMVLLLADIWYVARGKSKAGVYSRRAEERS